MKPQSPIKKITIEFNKTEFDVEYIVDKELYDGISVESIKLNDIEFIWNFNDKTLFDIEQLVLLELSK